MRLCPAAAAFAPLVLLIPPRAAAQDAHFPAPTSVERVIVGNALVGGATAALHAAVRRANPAPAFLKGVAGGALHGLGKVAIGRGDAGAALPGSFVSSIGISVIGNAGRGVGAVDELYVPFGPLRARIAPAEAQRLSFSLNLHEALVAAHSFSQRDRRIDWASSAESGTFVFRARGWYVTASGDTAKGVARASTVIISEPIWDAARTLKHELVHVQQHWFMQEAWGRPLEQRLRDLVPGGGRIPRWLELGFVPPVVTQVDSKLFGRPGPLREAREREAVTLTHEPSPPGAVTALSTRVPAPSQ